jgi:hypothetical protein
MRQAQTSATGINCVQRHGSQRAYRHHGVIKEPQRFLKNDVLWWDRSMTRRTEPKQHSIVNIAKARWTRRFRYTDTAWDAHQRQHKRPTVAAANGMDNKDCHITNWSARTVLAREFQIIVVPAMSRNITTLACT